MVLAAQIQLHNLKIYIYKSNINKNNNNKKPKPWQYKQCSCMKGLSKSSKVRFYTQSCESSVLVLNALFYVGCIRKIS